ncbi:MAG: hypothetical protein IKM86_05605, partial [Acidaminococcaceae bacterium]|nr:hypothetical protein [Acidaminococcaceae bacterium]
MKRLLTFCLAILFCLFFSGCYLDDFTSSEQNKQYDSAIKIFKEYLAKTDPNAKIKEVSSEKYLGENHQMQLTEFVSGEYQSGSKKLKFAVNTKTGDIYTSERADLYAAKTAALVNDMLGLQWTAVKPVVHISSRVDMHGKKPPIGGSNEDSELSGVLPVTIKDMDAFAKDSFKNKNYSVSLHFIYTGSPLRRAVMETAAEQFGSRVRLDLQRFPDELQKDVEAASRAAWGENPRWPMNGYDSLAVESLTIHGSDKLEHKQWQDYKGKAPFTIHYPARTLVREKQKDSSYKEQESRFDIARDMQIKQNGKAFEFVTTNNRKVKFFVFMDN